MRKKPRKITDRQRRARYAMRRFMWAAVGVVVLVGLVTADRYGVLGRAPQPDLETYHGKTFRVVKVIDGDTLDIDAPDRNGRATRIRLWGVDTPETVKPDSPVEHFGPEASRFTRELCMGKQVRIELEPGTSSRGKYGRLLAWVFLPDGRLLNRVIVEQGYGYADPRFFDHHLKRELLTLQSRARTARLGLWKDVKPSDLPGYHKQGRH